MTTLTKEFSLPKLKTVIRATVREELQELLGDPDFGLSLRTSIRTRLLQSKKSARAGRVVSADELIARLGLKV